MQYICAELDDLAKIFLNLSYLKSFLILSEAGPKMTRQKLLQK